MKNIRNKVKDLNRENLSEFIIIRVSIAEKMELREKAKDSKNLSKYIRHILHLDEKR